MGKQEPPPKKVSEDGESKSGLDEQMNAWLEWTN